MEYYLGIDGGGTKTTVAVSDEYGNVIYKSVGKTINFYSVGMEKARQNLFDVMEDVYVNIGNTVFKNAFIGCSALDCAADNELIKELCGNIINSEKIAMDSDAYVALFSGDNSISRCVVICGTGSMVIGEDVNKKIVVKGGWGHIIGDGGSAYAIAVSALKEAVVLYDENKTDEPIVKCACDFFETDDLRKIIDTVYSENTTKDKIAGFAKYISQVCEKGDRKCLEILSCECRELFRTVCSLLNEMPGCEIVYLYGGVFQNNNIFKNMFVSALLENYPGIKAEMLIVPPEEGALKIARETK